MNQIVNQIELTFHSSDKGQVLNSPSGVPQKRTQLISWPFKTLVGFENKIP